MTYVVLESQYQSSLTKACQRINESRDDVCVECVGYLLEELRDPKNVAAFKKDVESSNIFIGSLIFVQVLYSEVNVCMPLCSHELAPEGDLVKLILRARVVDKNGKLP